MGEPRLVKLANLVVPENVAKQVAEEAVPPQVIVFKRAVRALNELDALDREIERAVLASHGSGEGNRPRRARLLQLRSVLQSQRARASRVHARALEACADLDEQSIPVGIDRLCEIADKLLGPVAPPAPAPVA